MAGLAWLPTVKAWGPGASEKLLVRGRGIFWRGEGWGLWGALAGVFPLTINFAAVFNPEKPLAFPGLFIFFTARLLAARIRPSFLVTG